MAKINDEPHPYHREVMQHLFSAIFCEMLGHLNKEVNPSAMTADTKESIKQSDYILCKFIEMLSKDNGMTPFCRILRPMHSATAPNTFRRLSSRRADVHRWT